MATVKHLSYAGIVLPLTPSFLEDKWYRIIHDQYSFRYADFWNFDSPNSQALPTPTLPKAPKFTLDVLNWPTGASNPAFIHTIIETDRWNRISTACAPGGYNTPQDLVFYDGRVGKTVTASMFVCGAARPLNQLGNAFTDLWLLTLTDVRFYWYYARTQITTPISWAELYDQLASALNTTIAPDTINAAYGTPSAKWALAYQASTPAILDAVASNVGQRVVVGLDGSVKTVNWQTARTAAGNYVDNINGRVISGGLIRESDIGKYVPASVNTLFPDTSGGPLSTAPHVVNNTLPSLSISEYGTAVGIPFRVQAVYADLTYDGANAVAVNAYAVQAATDWYGWQLVDTDLVYPGIEPWVPTGWEDCIEWTLKLIENNPALDTSTNGDDPFTKTQIRRGPWTDNTAGNFYTPGGGGNVTITNNPTLYIPVGDEPEDPLPIPGPKGDNGADGVDGRDGIPGPDAEEAEYVPIVPGPMGLQGFTGTGIQGPPGPEADEGEYTPIVPGPIGLTGLTGVGVQGPPGRDGDDPEEPLVIPGPIGLQGLVGVGVPGIPGRDGEDAEDNLIIPGPQGIQGFTGTGLIGPQGPEGEEPELPVVIPGPMGLQGFTGTGIPGPPGPDGEESEYTPIVPGPIGLTGLTGTGVIGPRGEDGEEAEYVPIVPGPPGLQGLQGFTGTGLPGPPGQDGEDAEDPIIQLVQPLLRAITGQTYLASNYAVPSGSFTDTGLSVTLPSPGLYLLLAQVAATINVADLGGVVSSSIAVEIASSISPISDAATICTAQVINVIVQQTAPIVLLYRATNTAGSTTIKLRASRQGSTTYNTASVAGTGGSSGAVGTSLSYIKLGV